MTRTYTYLVDGSRAYVQQEPSGYRVLDPDIHEPRGPLFPTREGAIRWARDRFPEPSTLPTSPVPIPNAGDRDFAVVVNAAQFGDRYVVVSFSNGAVRDAIPFPAHDARKLIAALDAAASAIEGFLA